MEDLRDIIPGLRDAVEREEFHRNTAFLGVTELIYGVEVKPLTLAHLCRLQCVGSPFLCGGEPSAEDVAVFLWAVSTGYKTRAPIKRYFFARGLRKLAFVEAVKGIQGYLDEAFLDGPNGGSAGYSPSYWSGFASIVGALASEFHWSEQQIMDMPLKRVWQYLRIAQKRNNPKASFSNRISFKVRQDWLDASNSKN